MKQIMFVICVIILSGCMTQKRCFDKFPPEILTEYDTISLVEYKDTIVYDTIQGDTVYGEPSVIVIKDSLQVDPVRARTELSEAVAWIQNNELRLKLIQNDSILRFKLDSVIRISSDTLVITNTVIHEKEVTKPLWKYPVLWIFGILAFIMFLFFLRVLLK